jgi:hypothetical protein
MTQSFYNWLSSGYEYVKENFVNYSTTNQILLIIMKNSKLIFIWLFSVLFFNCTKKSAPNAIIVGSTLKAAISFDSICNTVINFEDLNNNVYGYRADALFAVPAIQAGGHSTIDESTDLGFNLFFDPNNTERKVYTIDGSSALMGTAYVFYTVSGTEYVSSDNNTGNLVVESLQLSSEGEPVTLIATFNDVEVVNNANPKDKRCISAFEIRFFN